MKMKAIFVTVSKSEYNTFGIFYCLGLLMFPLFEISGSAFQLFDA